MKSIRYTAILAAFAWLAAAQTPPAPSFDVASIKPSQATAGMREAFRENVETSPGNLTMRNMRLSSCIKWAYSVQEYQVSGPGWLTTQRFDIVAKPASPATEPELRTMLQSLLAERFKLALHRQTKEMTAFVLSVSKTGHKLTPSESPGPANIKPNKIGAIAQGATVADLATMLSNFLRVPVLDETGLTGRFDATIDASPYIEDVIAMKPQPGGPPPDLIGVIIRGLQEQLGLKLDSRKAAVDLLIIDRVERTPTEN
jgi:uncharacterized protein (TIGR03435 family)